MPAIDARPPSLAHELAIGTCRHHLPMVRVEASSFTDQAASTRSPTGRWFDIRPCAILRLAIGTQPRRLPMARVGH